MMNYNMQGMEKTIPELFAMLKAAGQPHQRHRPVFPQHLGFPRGINGKSAAGQLCH